MDDYEIAPTCEADVPYQFEFSCLYKYLKWTFHVMPNQGFFVRSRWNKVIFRVCQALILISSWSNAICEIYGYFQIVTKDLSTVTSGP